MRSFNSRMGADPAHDRFHHLETSWIFPVYVLASIRALIALYAFVTIFFSFGYRGTHGKEEANREYFSYFTHLSYWGVAFYFLFAAIHTFLYARTGRSVLLEKWPRCLRALHSLLYTTVVTFPFVVTIVYWVVLYEGPWFPETFEAWLAVSVHMMTAAFALFEIIFTTTLPLPPLHLPFLILILLLYISLAYLIHASQGFYVYGFLDPGINGSHSGRVAGYSFGIFAAVLVVFGLVWIAIWLRRRAVGDKVKWAKGAAAWNVKRGRGEEAGDAADAGQDMRERNPEAF